MTRPRRIITGPDLDAPGTCDFRHYGWGEGVTKCDKPGAHLASKRLLGTWRVLTFCGDHLLTVLVRDEEVEVP